ncbi:MAG: SDR family NAD(P)-dependent oxidoreductase [Pseudomonadota bacterium]
MNAQVEQYLTGRVAMITGGFNGIGKATVRALADRGAAVAIGARTIDESFVTTIRDTGGQVFAASLDVRDPTSVANFIDDMEGALGPADVLVNAAGITAHEYVCGHGEASWIDVIDTNLSGPFRTARACLPGMIERGWGRIINIGSTAARTATSDHAAYCASKSGLLGLSRALALEGAPHGVSCVVVSPTWVETDMLRNSMATQAERHGISVEEETAAMVADTPQKRLVQPEEIAATVAFLCRDEALGITMEDIQVNAGAWW